MKESMNICIISPDYPSEGRTCYTFVEQLVNQFALQGLHCIVVAVQSLTNQILRHEKALPYYEKKEIADGVYVGIYRPNYVSFSNLKWKGNSISDFLYEHSIYKFLRSYQGKIDVIYGHFWQSSFAALRYALEHHIPLFTATGESSFEQFPLWKEAERKPLMYEYVSGVVAVSTKCKDESIAAGYAQAEKIEVFPNGYDTALFCKKDRTACRKALGIMDTDFAVAFVGAMIPRKGAKRVSEALRKLDNHCIKAIFIGGGSEELPDYEHTIHQGPLPHSQIADYLNAADVFVLPTRNEGCCNAIVEAMACGLPIISSNLPFNWDILNEGNSLMVDPGNIDEISDAIVTLFRDQNQRERMSEQAYCDAQKLKIEERARKIVEFMEGKI